MYPDFRDTQYFERLPRPDRRPSRTASEIRLRIRRLTVLGA